MNVAFHPGFHREALKRALSRALQRFLRQLEHGELFKANLQHVALLTYLLGVASHARHRCCIFICLVVYLLLFAEFRSLDRLHCIGKCNKQLCSVAQSKSCEILK